MCAWRLSQAERRNAFRIRSGSLWKGIHKSTCPIDVKGASITLRQEVRRGDDLLLDARVKVAFVSGGRAKPIPKALRNAMKVDQT